MIVIALLAVAVTAVTVRVRSKTPADDTTRRGGIGTVCDPLRSTISGLTPSGGAATPPSCPRPEGGVFVPCPTSGPGVITIDPGTDPQSVVDNNPERTTFHLGTATYARFSVKPKPGDRFCGDGIGKTVLDGEGDCVSAISSASDPSIDDITIENMTAKNYCTAGSTDHSQVTFYSDGLNNIHQRADGWKVVSTEVDNSNVGISVGDHSYVAGNRFYHNYRSGMAGGGKNSVFEYNTLDQNDWFGRANSIDGDSQGSKSAITDGVIYRYNLVTDTSGPGLWVDTENSNCLFDHNIIRHLGDSGIFIEAGYNCTVRDNIIEDVGLQDNAGEQVGVGIEVSTAGPVDIHDNYIVNSHQGIVVHQDVRGADRTLGNYRGDFCANGGHIYSNYILERPFHDDITGQTMTPRSGWINSGANPGCRSADSNTWNGNHYYLDDVQRAAWLIDGHPSSWSQWRNGERDARGTVDVSTNFPAVPKFTAGQSGYAPS